MIEPMPPAGLHIGWAFGAIVGRTGFCMTGAISDAVALGHTARLRAWICAVAVAIIGTQALQFAGPIDLGDSIHTASRLTWLGHIAEGLAFGIGITLAGGCGSRTLALGSFLAIAGITFGGALTTHVLAEDSSTAAWHTLIGRAARG